ncbi:hypothetical protein [Streptomyces iconiensis]|uniref:Uncharacterized protein n=1 Tax=Streptomyces iconiensis TaxID=1384038 RepID=A0ABT6ZP54_9ACTN|nr:hypothetical protein [Streptomyces iconiensis]MDJ1130831.1 hypothetical protein [Streptomyces iconiensis]
MTPEPARHRDSLSAITAAEQAVLNLQDALVAVGVTLPSLGIDLLSCTRSIDPHPLVELGRCPLETAHRLAELLRERVH